MKNNKEKTSNKSVKKAKVVQLNNKKLDEEVKPQPGEEEVRELAELLYHQRIARSEYGTDIDDWLTAEEYLRNS